MKDITVNADFVSRDFKCCSYYGNPSYWVFFRWNGDILSGYTGSNCACGYSVGNFHPGDKLTITFHYTKTGSRIITRMEACN